MRKFGDKDKQPQYKGDVESGKPIGLGKIIYPNGSMYIGAWKNGKMDVKEHSLFLVETNMLGNTRMGKNGT